MIIGHQKQWEFFTNKIEQNQLAHAYLFCGQNEIGKKAFAIELAKLLNCKNVKNNKPCLDCRSCADIEKGNHPDFLVVRAGDDCVQDGEKLNVGISYNSALPDLKAGDELSNKHEIEVFQIRKAQDFLSLKSYFGGIKVVIVDNAEKMSTEAQNCFLKTLEEPKGDTLIILISSTPERLLSTIFSRCQTVKFFPSKEILEKSSCLPAGREKQKKEKEILDELLKIMKGSLVEKFAYTKNIKEEGGNAKEILEVLQKYFRSLLLQKIGGSPTPPEIYTTEKLVKIIKLIEDLILRLSLTNASPKLALEILLMEL